MDVLGTQPFVLSREICMECVHSDCPLLSQGGSPLLECPLLEFSLYLYHEESNNYMIVLFILDNHTRVHLRAAAAMGSDYINASFIEVCLSIL